MMIPINEFRKLYNRQIWEHKLERKYPTDYFPVARYFYELGLEHGRDENNFKKML